MLVRSGKQIATSSVYRVTYRCVVLNCIRVRKLGYVLVCVLESMYTRL